VLLLDFELLLEELDIQFIQDVAEASTVPEQQADSQAGGGQSLSSPSMEAGSAGGAVSSAPPSLHARWQASLLSVGFTHSTHGSRAEAGLKDLVLQDMLSDTAGTSAGGQHGRAAGASAGVSTAVAAAGPAALLRLFSSMSVEELQVGWSRQLSQATTLQDVQVVLGGLQIQVRAHIVIAAAQC
jgi:hypothetical protein